MKTRITRIAAGETLVLHADPERSFDRPIEVTTNPIDGATDVTDHAQPQLGGTSIVGVVSDLGLIGPGADRTDVGNGTNPVDEALRFFERAEEERLRVFTPRRGEESPMLLADWSGSDPRSDEVEFRLRFQKSRFAQSETVEIPPEQTPEPDLASESDQGSQTTLNYFSPEVSHEFTNESFADQFNQAKGKQTDKEVADKSLSVQGLEFFAGGGE